MLRSLVGSEMCIRDRLYTSRDYLTSKSSSGVNLQLGVEREVTVGVDVKGVSASSSATIPPPFTRAWGDSKGMSKLKNFFSQKKGTKAISHRP